MITVQTITEDNFKDCLRLTATVPEENYVDSVVYSLAEAWLYGGDSLPLAIYKEDILIGFLCLYTGEENYQIINFLIDDQYQHRGNGTQAAKVCLEYLRKMYHPKRVSVPVYLENEIALFFWKKLGFSVSDSVEDNYMYLRYAYLDENNQVESIETW